MKDINFYVRQNLISLIQYTHSSQQQHSRSRTAKKYGEPPAIYLHDGAANPEPAAATQATLAATQHPEGGNWSVFDSLQLEAAGFSVPLGG